jgi:hypothetical protein
MIGVASAPLADETADLDVAHAETTAVPSVATTRERSNESSFTGNSGWC